MYREGFGRVVGGMMNAGPYPNWEGLGGWGWLGLVLFLAIIVWSLVWKGFALWKAARNKSAGWFIVLLVVNTLGILEILYIFVFGRKCSCGKEECLECCGKEGCEESCCGDCCCSKKMCRNGKK